MNSRIKLLLPFMMVIVAFNGCKENNSDSTAEERQVQTSAKESLVIEDPWMRPANNGTNTALFFKVANNTKEPDTLYDAASDLAEIVEVHETYQKDTDLVGMRHVDHVVIPSGASIEFKPRNLHIMLIRLNDDLAIGDSGTVVLMFKQAGKIEVNAVVRDMPLTEQMSH